MLPKALAAALAVLIPIGSGSAWARAPIHGMAELRLGAADGEASWLDGGFGKGAVSGGEDGWTGELSLSQTVVEWRPSLGFSAGAVVSAQLQPDVDPSLDIDEAYLTVRAPPSSAGRLSARAGIFYPPVSMEHGGVGWTTTDLLSASAINSWIGEEVKVVGLEATFARPLGAHEVSATAGIFGWNDTSGTLLTFRGWALHGTRGGGGSAFPLPPLSPFMRARQAGETNPNWELDNRAGYYGRLEWRPPAPVSFNATYYDNAGDRTSVDALQWAWETRFLNLGARWDIDARTYLMAQAMNGETLMGFRTPEIWVDMGFRSAYVLAARGVGEGAVTARLDWFETTDRSWLAADNNDEEGWALTAGWRRPLTDGLTLMVEAQRIASDRPSRALAGETPRQDQTLLQSALRYAF